MNAFLLLCFAVILPGSPSPQAEASSSLKYPAAVRVTSPNGQYRRRVRSLREVDFKNLSYSLSGEHFLLRNGSARGEKVIEGTVATERFDIGLDCIWYFDFQDHQARRALISLWVVEAVGSSSNTGFILLFEIVNGHATITRQFAYDLQAPGTGAVFNPKTGLLRIKARANDGSAHCCPQTLRPLSLSGRDEASNCYTGISRICLTLNDRARLIR